jgi:hypothetical protein
MTQSNLHVDCEAPEQPTRVLEEHCYLLGDILSNSTLEESKRYGPEWSHAGEWLHLAAGVRRVEIIPDLFDLSGVYCGTVGDYQDARGKAISNYYTELTRFLFTWGAFETVVEAVRLPGWRDGKIRAVGQFLARRFEPDKLIHYGCAVSGLKQLISSQQHTLRIKDSDFVADGSYGESGIGLRVVYKLRNSFSHGSIKFPEPQDWGGRPRTDIKAARAATRIILFTIQMVLITQFSSSGILIKYQDHSQEGMDDDGKAIEIGDLVRTIHLNRPVTIL